MTPPTFMALLLAETYYTGCFLECQTPNRRAAAVSLAFALVFAAVPFVAVRIYQNRPPTQRRSRGVLLLLVVVLAAVVAHLTGTTWVLGILLLFGAPWIAVPLLVIVAVVLYHRAALPPPVRHPDD